MLLAQIVLAAAFISAPQEAPPPVAPSPQSPPSAVKTSDLTSPAMTGEWEYQLREMVRGKFSRENPQGHDRERGHRKGPGAPEGCGFPGCRDEPRLS